MTCFTDRSGPVTTVPSAFFFIQQLEAAYESLARLPDRGNVPKELSGVGLTEFREAHIGPYRMIYRVAARNVSVIGVLDGRRDVQSLLQRRLLR